MFFMKVFKYFCKLIYVIEVMLNVNMAVTSMSLLSILNLKYFFCLHTNSYKYDSNIISKSINFLDFEWNRYLF